jgi:hypothetical protein
MPMMTRQARRENAASEKKHLSTRAKVTVCVVLFAAMAVLLAPVIAQAMAAQAAAGVAAPTEAAETGMSIPFLSKLATSGYYGYYGSKTVSGQQNSYGIEFACTVQNGNFVIQTESDNREYRQLYVDGEFSLVDDTQKTVQNGVCKFDYLDDNLISAISGRIIRTSEDILDGSRVTRVEIYKDGTVFAYYLNQQGVLVRFYYIYDGNEVTLTLDSIAANGSGGASFDIPSGYSVK